ncbi:MAG: outer membrane lipoprotein carrier protein LolA [Bacteroidota bacterium]
MRQLLVILSLFAFLGLQAQDSKAEKIIAQSQSKLEGMKDFAADFSYSIENPNMNKPVLRNGKIKYKTGKFVIQLEDQEVYCDGVTQWIYLPSDCEITIMDYDPEEPWIESIFKIYEASSESRYDGEETIHGVKCHRIYIAIKDPSLEFNQAIVWINAKTNFLEKTALIDRKQTRNVYEFSSVKTDQGLSNLDFRFDIDAHGDCDVYDER